MNETYRSRDLAREQAARLATDRGEAVKVIAIKGRESDQYELGMASASGYDIERVYGPRAGVVEIVPPSETREE